MRWPRKKIEMQTTRLTSIGKRVEIATLMAVRIVTSKNPRARPGKTCKHLRPLTPGRVGPGRLAEVIIVLVGDPQREQAPRNRTSPARPARSRGTCRG